MDARSRTAVGNLYGEACRSGVPHINVRTDFLIRLIKRHPGTRQVSGNDFSRAIDGRKTLGFSPCYKEPQGLKAKVLLWRTARLKSFPDTCLGQRNDIALNTSPIAFLRASVSPWWMFSGVPA